MRPVTVGSITQRQRSDHRRVLHSKKVASRHFDSLATPLNATGVASFKLPRLEDVTPVEDNDRAGLLGSFRAKLYFDNKNTSMKAISEQGIACIHIADPGYSNESYCALRFPSWDAASKEMIHLVRLAEN